MRCRVNSKAEKQRTISLLFKADAITDTSRAAYDKLIGIDKKELAGILQHVLLHRHHFENWNKEYEKAKANLAPIHERRILDNHALILSFHSLFCSCFDIKQEVSVSRFFAEIGRQKCITSAIRQTTIADHFFELLDSIKEEKAVSAYHVDPEKGHILVNLPKVESILRNEGLNFQTSEPLNLALQRHPAYIRNGLTYRFPNDPATDGLGRKKLRKVWCFSLEWFEKNSKADVQ